MRPRTVPVRNLLRTLMGNRVRNSMRNLIGNPIGNLGGLGF
ncbi:hypothetical protein [Streptomyces arboris]